MTGSSLDCNAKTPENTVENRPDVPQTTGPHIQEQAQRVTTVLFCQLFK